MRHIFAEQARVERTVDEIALAEPQRVGTEHAMFDTVGLVARNFQPFFDKGPIGLDPRRIEKFGLDEECSARRVENPLVGRFPRFGQDRATAG